MSQKASASIRTPAGLTFVMVLSTALATLAGCTPGNFQPEQTPLPTESADGGGLASFGLQRADWEGVWSGREPDVVGYSDVQTVLMSDGTFSSQSRNAEAGTLVTVTGQWEIFNLTDGPMLRFAIEDFEPKEWCGPLGCVAIQVPTGQSRYFRFLDRDTVILRDPSCDSAACEATYRRG